MILNDLANPYRQAQLLQQALAPDKMRVAFFLGAGCPLSVRVPEGDSTKPLIPDIAGLTTVVSSLLGESSASKDPFEKIIARIKTPELENPTIEDILSHVRALKDVIRESSWEGLTSKLLADLDGEICRRITEVMQVTLPSTDTPYHRFASWVGGLKRAHPIEIFTPNYDLLIEQALEDCRVPYFDGFTGSREAFFDLSTMEGEAFKGDALPARWARLWKVHGSINWWLAKDSTGTKEVVLRCGTKEGARQMIHPSHWKYDDSRRMPYLAMQDRLRSFLSRGQAVLVTCGYSFVDIHLNEAIMQGLEGNPTAVCFALAYGDRASHPKAVECAKSRPNLRLLAADGGVINAVPTDWTATANAEHPLHDVAVKTGALVNRSNAPDERCKFLLGDFKAFGEFLAFQHGLDDDGLKA